ncbi:Siphovirus Gp157 family protein [uncultured Thiomicrorhabdus sp.]
MHLAIKETLDLVEGDFNDKAVNIVKLAKSLDKTLLEPLDEEIKRLQARKKAIKNRQDGLKKYLRMNMAASGIQKIECPLFSITLKKATQKVQITDESKIPDDLIKVTTSITPDKAEIAKRLKAGEEVEGAELVYGDQSLLIK